MSSSPLIFSLIPKVMGEVGAISKNRKNPQQGYSFRGIDDMYNAIQPAMVKYGIFCAPFVVSKEREERPSKSGGVLFYTTLTVKHTFFASDGSSVDVVTIGEAMDSGDKSSNKAMSAAMKYALIELFCIPTEEEKDTESQTHEPSQKTLTEQQIFTIIDMLEDVGISEENFCKAVKINSISSLPQSKFENAKAYIQKMKKPDEKRVA